MMDIRQLHETFRKSSGITTDSRKVEEGNIFFALQGENFDGNEYGGEALDQGALLAVVDDDKYAGEKGFMVVNDCLETLQQLATYHRTLFNIPVIAITGSNGKTTTKELVRDVLSSRYSVVATSGNLNNHIGVPLTVMEINDKTGIAVIEMGANHIGEIRDLCKIADPTHGLITNIGKAHLEGFGSLEGVIRAKSELYDHLRDKKGTVFVNDSQEILLQKSSDIDRVFYGSGNDALVTGKLTAQSPFMEAVISYPGGSCELHTQLFGTYNLHNVLASWCVGLFFNVEPEMIRKTIEEYKPDNLRSQIIRTGKNTVIMDTYNANPASMHLALADFSRMQSERKLLILGDMLELGSEEVEEHRRISEKVKQMEVENIIFVGPVFHSIEENGSHPSFRDVGQAMEWIRSTGLKGYTIFIKGSRKIGLEKVLPLV